MVEVREYDFGSGQEKSCESEQHYRLVHSVPSKRPDHRRFKPDTAGRWHLIEPRIGLTLIGCWATAARLDSPPIVASAMQCLLSDAENVGHSCIIAAF